MSEAIVKGNVTREPEVKFTQSGKQMLVFSLADNYKVGEKEMTDYWEVICWNDMAEVFKNFIHAKMFVTVCGKPDGNAWVKDGEAKYSRKIHANAIGFNKLQGDAKPVNAPVKDEDDDDPFGDAG